MSLPTVEEMTESLTYFDEIAIEKAFKIPAWSDLSATKVMCALVFIQIRREGNPDPVAFEQAASMSMAAIQARFDLEDVDPSTPDTDGGKDDSLDGTETTT